ncbi:putative hydrolase, CocE/NonD family [Synechococcus sp. PCC 7502]|uniref:CocE/NonD family hydrolase n=1 Tax=Synechococcus sp. PCC 7502 TaxID=1173263 RepID=UPI00029FF103|nr:CocE/NonD family hydrolase [Synechococcus sp. PCC 7502]AFY74329.1 putative hydrolase, CocE/NonD family [Synechococcus sp. PCC 7502]
MPSKIKVDRQVKIPMRDGINLTADIYRPRGVDMPLPVLLMRLPYGRAIASTVTYAHPSWYAAQGYIVVIQDVRGCGTSEGEFYPFRHEYEDGYDTVTWCAENLEGSNGKVGMYGFSYQGVTQLQAAVMQPRGLVTICPAMAGADLYDGWFYFGGAIALEFTLSWALQLTQNQAYYRKLEPQSTNLWQAQQEVSRSLSSVPLDQVPILKSDPLGQFFFDWLRNDQADAPYWQELNPLSRFAQFDLPALHIAGWADIFIETTIATYEAAKQVTNQPQFLIGSPWQHLPWRSQVGELNFGDAAIPQIDQLQVDWFDYWLKGIDNGMMGRSPVQLFLMGENRWLNLKTWEQEPEYQNFYLDSNSKITTNTSDLLPSSLPDIYIYDPRIPTPSTSYGAYDQSAINQRSDVLTYSSPPLTANLRITGIAEFILYAETSAPDTDWVVRLLDIYPDGRQMLVTMGVIRAKFRNAFKQTEILEPEIVLEYKIKLRPTCHSFELGHRLGIAIASAAFPLIERHTNTAKSPSTCTVSEFFEATQQIYHDQQFPSHLKLPLLKL